MSEERDPYVFQTSIKHGRNASIMTNVRGATPDEFGENLTLTKNEFAPLIDELATTLQAVDTLGEQFPGAEPVQEQPQTYQPQPQGGYRPQGQQPQGGYGGQPQGGGGGAQGAPCNHGVPRKFISGTSKKTGRPYAMWVCTVEQDPNRPQCQAVFQ